MTKRNTSTNLFTESNVENLIANPALIIDIQDFLNWCGVLVTPYHLINIYDIVFKYYDDLNVMGDMSSYKDHFKLGDIDDLHSYVSKMRKIKK